ncbi:MAG: hypothetical protein WDN04_05390 [Rhodospirillales bacterium]
MQPLSEPAQFAHQAFAVDPDGREVPIVADTILIRLANGECMEIPLDSFDAGDMLVYGGRMPTDRTSEAEMVAATRRLVISPGASNLIALSAVSVEVGPAGLGVFDHPDDEDPDSDGGHPD